jgi:hypothetical protein
MSTNGVDFENWRCPMAGVDISKVERLSSATIVLVKSYGLPYGFSSSHVFQYNVRVYPSQSSELLLPPIIFFSSHMAISHYNDDCGYIFGYVEFNSCHI